MIRRANDGDFVREIKSESELRICSLKRAYGLDVPFVQFFADEDGSIAAIMDGVCTIHCRTNLSEEWVLFLQMHSDIHIIHSEEDTVDGLAKMYGLPFKNGVVLRLDNVSRRTALQQIKSENISLRELYTLLSSTFNDLPPFDGWYVDASHRVRHGCCHIATVKEGEQLISAAMTVAETDTTALIGGVATLPSYRGRGAASQCVSELIAALPQKVVLIAPSDEHAARLYKRLGFVPWGTWAELTLP